MDMPGLRSERYPPRLSPTHCRCALPHAAGGHARAARTIDGPPGLETTPAKLLAGLDRPLVVDLAALDRRPRRRDLDPRFRHRGPAPGSNSGRIGPGMSRHCQRLSARGRDRSTRLSLPHPGRHRGPATRRCRCPSGAAVASGVVQKRDATGRADVTPAGIVSSGRRPAGDAGPSPRPVHHRRRQQPFHPRPGARAGRGGNPASRADGSRQPCSHGIGRPHLNEPIPGIHTDLASRHVALSAPGPRTRLQRCPTSLPVPGNSNPGPPATSTAMSRNRSASSRLACSSSPPTVG